MPHPSRGHHRVRRWLSMGPALAGALAGLLDQEDGRQLIRLRMPPAEDASRPWDRPLLLMTAVRWDPVRSATMRPNELARELLRAFARAVEARRRARPRVRLIVPCERGPVAPGMRTDSGRGRRRCRRHGGLGRRRRDPGLWLLGLVGFGARGGLVLLTLPVLTIPSPVLLSILFRDEIGHGGHDGQLRCPGAARGADHGRRGPGRHPRLGVGRAQRGRAVRRRPADRDTPARAGASDLVTPGATRAAALGRRSPGSRPGAHPRCWCWCSWGGWRAS